MNDNKEKPPVQCGMWREEIALIIGHHQQLANQFDLDGEYHDAEVLRERVRHLRTALAVMSWPGPERSL